MFVCGSRAFTVTVLWKGTKATDVFASPDTRASDVNGTSTTASDWRATMVASAIRDTPVIAVNCLMFNGGCTAFECINGYCYEVNGTYGHRCVYRRRYTGTHCEVLIDYCASSPCFHGDCVNEESGFTCIRCNVEAADCFGCVCVHVCMCVCVCVCVCVCWNVKNDFSFYMRLNVNW